MSSSATHPSSHLVFAIECPRHGVAKVMRGVHALCMSFVLKRKSKPEIVAIINARYPLYAQAQHNNR